MPAYRGESGVSAASAKPRPLIQKMTSARYSGEYGERALGIADATIAVYPSARTVPTAAEKYVSLNLKRPKPLAAMEMSTDPQSRDAGKRKQRTKARRPSRFASRSGSIAN